MGEQPQPERKIELCTQDVVDLPIINLQDAGRPFKIKVSTIRMTIVKALENFNEYMRVKLLEWHIDLLKRRMEKMEMERKAQDLKAVEARSTCEECEEYDHVQAKINKDVITKFEVMEKILENLDGKVTEVGSSIREVFIMIKMLEMQVGQLVGRPMSSKGEYPR
jgi:uncharacterized membrane protein YkoI